MYKTDRQRYVNYLQQVENDLLQHEDTFAKTVAVASRILTGWNGKYNDRDYKTTDVNDCVAFVIRRKQQKSQEKSN